LASHDHPFSQQWFVCLAMAVLPSVFFLPTRIAVETAIPSAKFSLVLSSIAFSAYQNNYAC